MHCSGKYVQLFVVPLDKIVEVARISCFDFKRTSAQTIRMSRTPKVEWKPPDSDGFENNFDGPIF